MIWASCSAQRRAAGGTERDVGLALGDGLGVFAAADKPAAAAVGPGQDGEDGLDLRIDLDVKRPVGPAQDEGRDDRQHGQDGGGQERW